MVYSPILKILLYPPMYWILVNVMLWIYESFGKIMQIIYDKITNYKYNYSKKKSNEHNVRHINEIIPVGVQYEQIYNPPVNNIIYEEQNDINFNFNPPEIILDIPLEKGKKNKKKYIKRIKSFFKKNKKCKYNKNQFYEDAGIDPTSCIICMDAKIDTLLYPCCHMEVCSNCSKEIFKCCTCRNVIEDRIKVYSPFN